MILSRYDSVSSSIYYFRAPARHRTANRTGSRVQRGERLLLLDFNGLLAICGSGDFGLELPLQVTSASGLSAQPLPDTPCTPPSPPHPSPRPPLKRSPC